ncbi:hypothetical protein HBH98_151280 [Parastagonospora nodorum]|nr:hypothetical protein HBH52_003620 [Parastagonospora nodorum]KAH4343554.1 hypothetical protein HBH98_151280 [Parastagonospora nodorum]KAH4355065.1 hypothetical protein HBH97_241630 [Parastagonospora nodorum]KAH4398575.1 hypothetical protein HBH99_106590 [Parastagonospora nodorum]KAH4943108.1 hypothetical protein HBI79_013980 [Parastagonospora nodorum]
MSVSNLEAPFALKFCPILPRQNWSLQFTRQALNGLNILYMLWCHYCDSGIPNVP